MSVALIRCVACSEMADKKSDEKKKKKKRGVNDWLVEEQRKEEKEIAETQTKFDAAKKAFEDAGREAKKLASAPNDALTLALLAAAIPYRLSDIGYSRRECQIAIERLRDCLDNFSGGSDQLVAVKSELLRLCARDPFHQIIRVGCGKTMLFAILCKWGASICSLGLTVLMLCCCPIVTLVQRTKHSPPTRASMSRAT